MATISGKLNRSRLVKSRATLYSALAKEIDDFRPGGEVSDLALSTVVTAFFTEAILERIMRTYGGGTSVEDYTQVTERFMDAKNGRYDRPLPSSPAPFGALWPLSIEAMSNQAALIRDIANLLTDPSMKVVIQADNRNPAVVDESVTGFDVITALDNGDLCGHLVLRGIVDSISRDFMTLAFHTVMSMEQGFELMLKDYLQGEDVVFHGRFKPEPLKFQRLSSFQIGNMSARDVSCSKESVEPAVIRESVDVVNDSDSLRVELSRLQGRYDRQADSLARLNDDLSAAKSALASQRSEDKEDRRGELSKLKSRVIWLENALSEAVGGDKNTETELPSSWEQMDDFERDWLNPLGVYLTDKAKRTARSSDFLNIPKCYELLLWLGEEYVPSVRGGHRPHVNGFKVGKVGSSAFHGGYKTDYEVTYRGMKSVLDRHISEGTSRDPRYCLRIYFTEMVIDDKPCLLVGHMPGHLRNALS